MEIKDAPSSRVQAAASAKPASLADYLKSVDPQLAKKTDEIKRNLQNVLTTLKSGKTDFAAQRKQMAMQKVALIKQQIQALKMSGIVDPKMVARMAEKLAKDLAQAVKDYTSAGGSVSDIGSTSVSVNPPGADASASSTADSASSAASSGDLSAANTASAAESAVADAPVPDAENAAQQINATDGSSDKTSASAADKYGARQSGDTSNDKNKSDRAQDDAFKADVRDAVKELRKLIRQNKFLLTQDKDVKRMENAEDDLSKIERTLIAMPVGGGVSLHI